MKSLYRKIRNKYEWGKRILADKYHAEALLKTELEDRKRPVRTDVINFLIESIGATDTNYLEIGVRNPAHNFGKIKSKTKYSVDPGVEFKENPVDFKLTSDEFFEQLRKGAILDKGIKFDVIFIDGLHFAEQTERDIRNSLDFIAEH